MRFNYSHVMSTAAVFLALGGTGYAAATISSKNVKDGSLKGKDIRDSSLTGRDVRDGSLRAADFGDALPGGAQGAAGPQGPQGAQGPRGPSNAVIREETRTLTLDGNGTVILGVTLPAGRWVVSASTTLNTSAVVPVTAACELFPGPVSIAKQGVGLGGDASGGDPMPIGMTGGVELSQPGGIAFVCRSTPGGVVNALNPSITAIQVATLDDQG